MIVTMIGDIHGHVDQYIDICRQSEYTLQLGDFGVGFSGIEVPSLSGHHRAFVGNHDNRQYSKKFPLFLDDFGMWNRIFYFSGADSIDKANRIPGISWWEDEEMSYQVCTDAISLYESVKPEVVASHDCPQSIFENYIFSCNKNRTRTRMAMQTMMDIHKPRVWCFAHHHVTWNKKVGRTLFACLNKLETFRVDMSYYD